MIRFADTYFYLALLNSRDATHARAVALSQQLAGIVLTTEFVLLELADGMSRPPARDVFVRFCDSLRDDERVEIVRASTSLWERGRQLYADRHFEQAGFVAL